MIRDDLSPDPVLVDFAPLAYHNRRGLPLPAPTSIPTGERWFLVVIFVLAVCWNLGMASVGWSHALSDVHGWRQTQTAITAYYMQRGGPWLRYETPVLGPPWRIPHEFPVYQAVVVVLSDALGLSLESAGRATALGFFYLTLGGAWLLLAEAGLPGPRRLLVLALWLLSPLYVFWSRTFMVESTALCLCVFYLFLSLRYLSRGRPATAVLAVLAGGLGAAVKPITVAPFVVLAGLVWLGHAWRRDPRPRPAFWVVGALVVVSPLGIGWLWQRFADGLKGLDTNALAWGIGSQQLFRDWIYGPPGSWSGLDVRMRPGNWLLLWARASEVIGHPLVGVAALVGVFVAARRRVVCLLALAAFLTHFVAFMPLHIAHPYYMYAAGCLLVTATGIAAVALLECGDGRRYLAWLLVALFAATAVGTYWTAMLPVQRRDAYRKPAWFIRLAREVARVTRPDQVLVVFGMNWDPEVPYYAGRRALMWPGWGDVSADGKDVANASANLRGYSIGAVVSCTDALPDATLVRFRALLRDETEEPIVLPGPGFACYLYYGRQSGTAAPASGSVRHEPDRRSSSALAGEIRTVRPGPTGPSRDQISRTQGTATP
jgi:hypothetical protein